MTALAGRNGENTMQTFTTILARDLREQRFTLGATLGAGVVLTALGALLLDPSILDSDVFARVATMALGGLAALAVGCDLGSRDRAEGSQNWLLRQPFPLPLAVASKLLTLIAAIAVGLAIGAALAFGASLALGSGSARLAGSQGEWIAVLAILAAGLWSAAASSWLPRGFLAAPGGLMAFLLCASPAWFPLVWWELFPGPPVLQTLVAGLVTGGLASFATGMLFGARTGGSPPLRASASLAAGALCMVPLWVAAGAQTRDALTHDVGAEPMMVTEALLSKDRATLLVNASEAVTDWRGRDLSQRVYAVDLASGTFEPASAHGQWLERIAETADGTVAGALLRDHEGGVAAVDGRGRAVEPDQVDERAFAPDVEVPNGYVLDGRAGAGWRLKPASGGAPIWFEAGGGSTLDALDLARVDKDVQLIDAWWLGDRWLVERVERRAGVSPYSIFSAGTSTLEAADWLPERQALITVLADGRAIVLRATDEPPLAIVDVVAGTTTTLPIHGAPETHPVRVNDRTPSRFASEPWFAGGTRLTGEAHERLLWIDRLDQPAPRARMTPPLDRPLRSIVGTTDGDSVLAITQAYTRSGIYGRVMKRMTILDEGSAVVELPLTGGATRQVFP